MRAPVYPLVTLMTVILTFQASHEVVQSTVLKNNLITKGFRQNLDTGIEARFQTDFKMGKKHFKMVDWK